MAGDTAARDTARDTARNTARDTATRDTAPRDTAPRDTATRDTATQVERVRHLGCGIRVVVCTASTADSQSGGQEIVDVDDERHVGVESPILTSAVAMIECEPARLDERRRSSLCRSALRFHRLPGAAVRAVG
ncbi:unannotated protein [freshwater metagenome]|uniref:Unannotated protein n=1 Tax=freshwater metagenome TaxID=449393 RepID=A0A6J7KHA8_9ZZZZ